MAGSSPLLSLPPELRNRIYAFAVFSPKHIVVGTPSHKRPPLARTNRQLRSEVALAIYLSHNTFRLRGIYGRAWLCSLSDKNRAQIRRLHIDLGASRLYLDEMLKLGLTPALWYDEDDAGLGMRIIWVGAEHMPEVRKMYLEEGIREKQSLTKDDILYNVGR